MSLTWGAALRSDDFVFELNKSKDGLIRFPLACIILQDWDSISDPRWKEDILKWLCQHEGKNPAPLCTIPSGWRMPQVLKAIGAFKSAGEAARNGWNKEIEEGAVTHLIRLGHAKRAVITFRPPAKILNSLFEP